jgi:hypothetical protein
MDWAGLPHEEWRGRRDKTDAIRHIVGVVRALAIHQKQEYK